MSSLAVITPSYATDHELCRDLNRSGARMDAGLPAPHHRAGVFVEGVPGASADVRATDSMLLHTYWDTRPMARGAAEDFVRRLSPQEVAVMISANSGTPLEVRRQALSAIPSTVVAGR
jgi:hypothetical protein